MKVGESKTFPLQFPADYHGADVAGKEADFMVTLSKIEAQNLPAVDEALAKSLGIKEGTVEGLRADVKKNLEREVKFRVLARNKAAVMDALAAAAELDLPNALIALLLLPHLPTNSLPICRALLQQIKFGSSQPNTCIFPITEFFVFRALEYLPQMIFDASVESN